LEGRKGNLKDIYFLTRQLLGFRLSKRGDATEEAALAQQFMAFGAIYVIAEPETTPSDWQARSFGILTEDKALRLYAERSTAERDAISAGAMLPGGIPMVMKISPALALSLVAMYHRKGFIDSVWLCGAAPISAKVRVTSVVKDLRNDTPSTIMTDPDPVPEIKAESPVSDTPQPTAGLPPKESLIMVDDVRKTLDACVPAERRKIDPGKLFENFSKTIEKLIQVNGIDPLAMDVAFGLPPGYTNGLCKDQTQNVTRKILLDILGYFELENYQYAYKSQCAEIQEELRKHPYDVDLYTVLNTSSKTKERFRLEGIQRATLPENSAYVYKLTLKSKSRTVDVMVSSNYRCIEGKEYEIKGLEPIVDNDSPHDAMDTSATAPPTKDEEDAVLESLNKKGDRQKQSQKQPPQKYTRDRYVASPEEKMEHDRNIVLSYIIQTEGCSPQDARKKMAPFDDIENILSSFAKWVEKKKPGGFASHGYRPQQLMGAPYRFSPLEAYLVMAQLETKPKETMQMLKYRETDPQYQPQPKAAEKK